MTAKTQFNVRLPAYTMQQIELIQSTFGFTQVQVIILAVERLKNHLDLDLYSGSSEEQIAETYTEVASSIESQPE